MRGVKVSSRTTAITLLAVALATLATVAVWPAWQDPVEWTPDALYYQARVLELRGEDDDAALEQTFRGPLSADLRAGIPATPVTARGWSTTSRSTSGDSPCRRRARRSIRLAGERSLLYLSLAGYVAAMLALFGLLLLRFRIAIAAGVAARGSAAAAPHATTRRTR